MALFIYLFFLSNIPLWVPLGAQASLVAQLIKNPPVMWEAWVLPLGGEDPRRREKLPTPVFWPGEFHGLYGPWGRKESDMTERLSLSLSGGSVPAKH